MLTLISRLKKMANDHALYTKTRNEIAQLPNDIALDIGIYPGDADAIARKTVWG